MTSTEDQRKSVLITGCSPGGIGNSLAREFHRNGLRVFATARDAKSLEDLAALGIETLSLIVDDEDSIKACYAEVEKKLAEKGLDYLVNNAGRNYTVPAMEADLSEARATFETNFIAVICMCKTFLPLLIRAQGTIVQIGSVAGVIPYVFGSVYNASKAALHSFSDSLRVELAPFGVHVTTVITGGVQSRIARIQRTLVSSSLYAPIEDEYHRRVTHSQSGAMPHATYARSVVAQVLFWRKRPTPLPLPADVPDPAPASDGAPPAPPAAKALVAASAAAKASAACPKPAKGLKASTTSGGAKRAREGYESRQAKKKEKQAEKKEENDKKEKNCKEGKTADNAPGVQGPSPRSRGSVPPSPGDRAEREARA